MAKPWKEVEASPEFQGLTLTEKREARDEYFSTVVAPQVPEAERDAAWQAFYDRTGLPEEEDLTPLGEVLSNAPERAWVSGQRGAAGAARAMIELEPRESFDSRIDASMAKDETDAETALRLAKEPFSMSNLAQIMMATDDINQRSLDRGEEYYQRGKDKVVNTIANTIFDQPVERLDKFAREKQEELAATAPVVDAWYSPANIADVVATSGAQAAPFMIAAAATRKPSLAMGPLSVISGGDAYQTQLEQGMDIPTARAAGLGYGAAEMIGEKIGLDALMKRGLSLPRRLAYGAVGEGGGEMLTQAGQSGIDLLTINPDMTAEEFMRDELLAGIAGAGGGVVMGGPFHAAEVLYDKYGTETPPPGQTPPPGSPPPPQSPPAAPAPVSVAPGGASVNDLLPPDLRAELEKLQQEALDDTPGDPISQDEIDEVLNGNRPIEEILQKYHGPIVDSGAAAPVLPPQPVVESAAAAPELPPVPTIEGDGSKGAPVRVQDDDGVLLAGSKAASSPFNDLPEPTEAQKQAGNYQKGHLKINGLDIAIETPRGGKRSGTGPDGKPWEVQMRHDYGYIKRTEGADGDQIDTFIGPNPTSSKIFVIDQVDPDTGKFDEAKVMMGFDSEQAAVAAYNEAFSDGKAPLRMGGMQQMGWPDFKNWVRNADTSKPVTDLPWVKNRLAFESQQQPESKSPFPDIDAKLATMQEPQARRRLESLNKKFQTNHRPTTAEMYEQEALSARLGTPSVTDINAASKPQGAEIKTEQPAPGRAIPSFRPGREDEAITPRRNKVRVQYGVVEAGELTTSQTDEMVLNPNFPAELQPRDRSRFASHQQIQDIAQNLEPRLVMESPQASEGAPIISADGVVESGNGRVLAIRRAYTSTPDVAERYRSALRQAGYDVDGMKAPVLVRLRTQEMTPEERAAFTREANERTTASMSSTEQAEADARALPDALLDIYQGGGITQARNRDFVRGFVQAVIPKSEQASAFTEEGGISNDLVRRINAALVAKAYGDTDLLQAIVEETDRDLKSLGDGLLDAAGAWAKMRQLAADGVLADVDDTEHLVEGVKIILQARRSGRNPLEYLKQDDIFEGAIDPQTAMWVRIFHQNDELTKMRGRERIAGILTDYVNRARETKPGADLLGDAPPTPQQLLATTKEKLGDDRPAEASQADLLIPGSRAPRQDGGGERALAPEAGRKEADAPGGEGVSREDGAEEGQKPRITVKKAEIQITREGVKAVPIEDDDMPALIETPNGRWAFVGKVPDALAFESSNPDYIKQAKQHGPGLIEKIAAKEGGVFKNRSFATREEGIAAWEQFKRGGAAPAADVPETNFANTPETGAEPGSYTTANLHQFFLDALRSGTVFKSIVQARQAAARAMGKETIGTNTAEAKAVDEAIEVAHNLRARELAAEGKSPAEVYDSLVQLYENQPILAVRSSTSMENQAFSTPAPIAYLASRLVGVSEGGKIYEPTAGNGALLIEATDGKSIVANELDRARTRYLEEVLPRGARITQSDATEFQSADAPFDIIIANPPFGKALTGARAKVFKTGVGTETSELDEAIMFKALEQMKADGRAVFIIGSKRGISSGSPEMAKARYNTKSARGFFKPLFDNYNVTHHFTLSGDLYKKQGAGYPIDILVIDGKGKSALALPGFKLPKMYSSFEELKEVLNAADIRPAKVGNARVDSVLREPGEAAGRNRPAADDESRGSAPAPRAAEPDAGGNLRIVGGTDGGGGLSVDSKQRSGERPAEPGRNVRDAQAEPSREGEEGGARGARDGESRRAGGRVDRGDTGAADQPVKRERVERKKSESGYQVSYHPRSKGKPLGTLVPVNMMESIEEALDGLERRVGNIDSFVSRSLGYPNVEAMREKFGAEQIEAIAMAIDNIEQGEGFVIGDQTGVGKGRVNAAILRYARLQGKIPVFITMTKGLYGDMYRDLAAIGEPTGFKALITNSDMRGAKEEIFVEETGDTLRSLTPKQLEAALQHIQEKGELPAGYDYLFTTYSQLQTIKGEAKLRHKAIVSAAGNAILSLDESHNAGGAGKGGWQKKMSEEAAPFASRAALVRHLVDLSGGTFYSSATYAKNPDVMDLYRKTAMRYAVDDPSELAEAIRAGGNPMQQWVANALTLSGQYVRREKSFDGISMKLDTVKASADTADRISSAIGKIFDFDLSVKAVKDNLGDELAAEAEALDRDNAIGEAGVSSTSFASILHNLVSQTLVALTVNQAVAKFVQHYKAGQKVVIALSNTNEAFFDRYIQESGIAVGQEVPISFNDVLLKYLDRTLEVTVKDAYGKREHRRLTDAEIGKHGGSGVMRQYRELRKEIQALDLSGLPVSPIDFMLKEMQAAGMKVGEITGRQTTLKYDGERMIYERREASDGEKKRTISRFNGGELDAIILNRSGSTGYSMHAGETFKDKRQRHMSILQADPNIDVFMQTLGRVNRTGQVELPEYTIITPDLPAARRPAAVLMRKLASLNANTTANRDSNITISSVVDFMNPYGDTVVFELLSEEPKIAQMLDIDLEKYEDNRDGLAAKVTGRLTIFSAKEQERVYGMIERAYTDLIKRLDALGENALVAKELDLKAQTVSRREVTPQRGGSRSAFAEPSYLEKVSVKVLGKPYKWEEIQGFVEKNRPGKPLVEDYQSETRIAFEKYSERLTEAKKAHPGDDKHDDVKKAQEALDNATAIRNNIVAFVRRFGVGDNVIIKTESGNLPAVVINVERESTNSPIKVGQFQYTFALADASREVTIPLTQMIARPGKEARYDVEPWHSDDEAMRVQFEKNQQDLREERYMLTGNLLAGYAKFPQGRIVLYTRESGDTTYGVLLPRSFRGDAEISRLPLTFTSAQEVIEYAESMKALARPLEIKSSDGAVVINADRNGDDITVTVRAKDGRAYILDKDVRAVIGDFYKRGSGGAYEKAVSGLSELSSVISAWGENLDAKFVTAKDQDVLRSLRGEEDATMFMRPSPEQAGEEQVYGDTGTWQTGPGYLYQPKDAWTRKEKRMAEKLRKLAKQKFGKDFGVRFYDAMTDMGGNPVAGSYAVERGERGSVARFAALVLSGKGDVWKLNHEGIHFLYRTGAFGDSWAVLRQQARSKWIEQFKIRERYEAELRAATKWDGTPLTEAEVQRTLEEEAVAEAFAAYENRSRFQKVWDAIRDFLAAFRRELHAEGFQRWEDIFSAVSGGSYTTDGKKGTWQDDELTAEAYLRPQIIKDVIQAVADSGAGKWARDTLSGPGVKTADFFRVITRTNDHVLAVLAKRYKSATIEEIRHMIYAAPGEQDKAIGAGLDEAVRRQTVSMLNRLGKIFDGMRPDERARVTKLVQYPNTASKNQREVTAAVEVTKLLAEHRRYLRDRGIKISDVQGYFPRVYDAAKAAAEPQKFLKAAEDAYYVTYKDDIEKDILEALAKRGAKKGQAVSPADMERLVRSKCKEYAKEWLHNLQLQDMDIDPGDKTLFGFQGGLPVPNHLKKRVLAKDADDILREFLVQEPFEAISGMIIRTTRRAEFEHRFGPKQWSKLRERMIAEGVDQDGIDLLRTVIKSSTYNMGTASKNMRNAAHFLRSVNFLAHLPRVLLSSIPEPALVGVRTGKPTRGLVAFYNTMSQVKRGLLRQGTPDALKEYKELAEYVLGMIGQHAEMLEMQYRVGQFDKSIESTPIWVQHKFFRAVGLTQYTEYSRISTVREAVKFIERMAADILNPKAKHRRAAMWELRQLGIPDNRMTDFAKFVAAGNLTTDKLLASNRIGQFESHEELAATALRRFAEQVIMEPKAAERQTYAQHPLGNLVYSLQAYFMSFSKNVIMREFYRTQEAFAKGKGYTMQDRLHIFPNLLAHGIVLALAALVTHIRDEELYPNPHKKEEPTKPFDYALRILSRAGYLGGIDPYVNYVRSLKYAHSPSDMLIGPAVKNALEIPSATLNLASDRNSPNTNTAERRAVKAYWKYGVVPTANWLAATKLPVWAAYPTIQGVSSPQMEEAFVTAIAGKKKEK